MKFHGLFSSIIFTILCLVEIIILYISFLSDFPMNAKQNMIHMMEILQNFSQIQDLDYGQFIHFCQRFAAIYRDEVFEQIYLQMKYQKKTISFLRNILMHYHVPNNLNRYLSSLSEYKHPTMEEIYEAAHIPMT